MGTEAYSFALDSTRAAAVTGGDLSAQLAEYWVKEALTNLPPDAIFVDICADGGPGAWKQIPVHAGRLVHFYRLPVLPANTTAVAEGDADPTPVTASLVGVTAVIAMYLDTMLISDAAERMGLKPAQAYASQMLAQRMVRSFDSLINIECTASGTAKYCQTASGGAAITALADVTTACLMHLWDLEKLAQTFENANVKTYPNTGRWKLKTHPTSIKDLRAQTGDQAVWNLSLYLRDEEHLRGRSVGDVANFRIDVSTEVMSAAVAPITAEARLSVAAGYESVGAVSIAGNWVPPKKGTTPGRMINRPRYQFNARLIYHDVGSAGTEDPADRRASVAYKFWTVIKTLDANRLYTLRSYDNTP